MNKIGPLWRSEILAVAANAESIYARGVRQQQRLREGYAVGIDGARSRRFERRSNCTGKFAVTVSTVAD